MHGICITVNGALLAWSFGECIGMGRRGCHSDLSATRLLVIAATWTVGDVAPTYSQNPNVELSEPFAFRPEPCALSLEPCALCLGSI